MELLKIKSNRVTSLLKTLLGLPFTYFFLNPRVLITTYKALDDMVPAYLSNFISCHSTLALHPDSSLLVLNHNKQILSTDPLYLPFSWHPCFSLVVQMAYLAYGGLSLNVTSLDRPFLAKTALISIPFFFCFQGIYHHLILNTCLLPVFLIRMAAP